MSKRNSIRRRSVGRSLKKNGGFTIEGFIFWAIAAALAFIVVISAFGKGMAMYRAWATQQDIVQIYTASEDAKGGKTDRTGVDMTKLCAAGYGNQNATWCGSAGDGKNANQYGGDYTIKVSSNTARVEIGITGVDSDYVNALANRLAQVSYDGCATADSCSTIKVAGTTITVTK